MRHHDPLPEDKAVLRSKMPAVAAAVQTPGQALDSGTRAEMEARFGFDFGRVRVHSDEQARAAARSVDAVAFTYGDHVVLGVPADRHLLAHELAHVVQQSGSVPGGPALSTPGDVNERAADSAADAVASGRDARLKAGSVRSGTVMRGPAQDRGYAGEQQMGFTGYRAEDGWRFLEGPSGSAGHAANAKGFDGVAVRFRGNNVEIHILDNKSLARGGNVSSATALTKNLTKNLNDLITRISAPGYNALKPAELTQVRNALVAARTSILTPGTPMPASVRLVVTNAGGASTGVTASLAQRGVIFRDLNQIGPPATGGTPPPTQTPPAQKPPPAAPAPQAQKPPTAAPAPSGQKPPTAAPAPQAQKPPVVSAPKPAAPPASSLAQPLAKHLSEEQRAIRRLVTVAKVAKAGIAVLTIIGELHTAFAMMDMAQNRLAGDAFVLGDELKRAGKLRDEAATLLKEYQAYHDKLVSWQWQLVLLLGWNYERVKSAAFDSLEILGELESLITDLDARLTALEKLRKLTQAREKAAEQLLKSGVLGAGAIAATVFGAWEDLGRINGALGSAIDSLTKARAAVVADKPFFVKYIRECKAWMLKAQGDPAGDLP